ncbi:hypothetical protein [Marinobacterium rhizophilum]|uniref:hypothetical protein n=1 Tax=Marinobacterium rhizophilum TaxID=420402 RepID=UPI0003716CEE|nr:hypothetical protein [Marinobacterium rhizophilum]
MFNGLDELEDFAAQLAPLTPEEAAAWKKKEASLETERTETAQVPDDTVDRARAQEAAPELGTIQAPVFQIAPDPEPPLVQPGSPESTPVPADEREFGRDSTAAPVHKTVPQIEALPQAEVLQAQPVPASQAEQEPGATTRPYARYVVLGGVLLLGLVTLLV